MLRRRSGLDNDCDGETDEECQEEESASSESSDITSGCSFHPHQKIKDWIAMIGVMALLGLFVWAHKSLKYSKSQRGKIVPGTVCYCSAKNIYF